MTQQTSVAGQANSVSSAATESLTAVAHGCWPRPSAATSCFTDSLAVCRTVQVPVPANLTPVLWPQLREGGVFLDGKLKCVEYFTMSLS